MRARVLARWALGFLILAALVATLDVGALGARLAAADLRLVAVAVIGLSCLHLLGAATWRELTRRLSGFTLGWRQTVRLYYAGQAVGGLTPANLGSDAYRVVALRRAGQGAHVSMFPIAVQRATSYLAVSLVGAVALLVASRPSDFTVGLTIGALVVSGVAVGVASLVSVRPGPMRPLRDRLLGPEDPGRRRGLPGAVGVGLGLGLAFHVIAVCLTFLLVLAVDPEAGSVAALAAVAVARVSLLIPLTPSGLGVGEAALAFLFVGIGLPAESAIAASLLARLSLVLTAVLGAGVVVLPARHLATDDRRPPADSVRV